MGFWWCCCGPRVESCDSSVWPLTLTLTTNETDVTLTKNLTLNIWEGTLYLPDEPARSAVDCGDTTGITVKFELSCVAGVATLIYKVRYTTGPYPFCTGAAPPCTYGTALPTSNFANIPATATNFTDDPFSYVGTWSDTIPGSYGTPSWGCPGPPITGDVVIT